jgi:hypothetical protein
VKYENRYACDSGTAAVRGNEREGAHASIAATRMTTCPVTRRPAFLEERWCIIALLVMT